MAEMDKLLEKYNLPRLKQEEIENMNQTMTTTKIEHMIKKKKKKQGQMASQGNSQTFREDQIPVVLKFFQKISEGGTLLNSFYNAIITLIPKPKTTQN